MEVDVSKKLRSPKLEIPEGAVISRTLSPVESIESRTAPG
jgi:hypothetical protein